MQTPTTLEAVPADALASWQRARSDDELIGLISRRTEMLGELDDDDFELATI